MTAIAIALILWANPSTPEREAEVRDIADAVEIAAEMRGEDPWRWAALVSKESGVRADVVGKLGERGPAQVIPHYVDMSRDEVATPMGGLIAAVIALDRWELQRPKADPWQCFASGRRCAAPRAMRRLAKREAELRALYAGWVAAGGV